MLTKLSLRAAKRQAGDYLVYFISITLAAALIYAFNELAVGPELNTLAEGIGVMGLVIALVTIVVVCILGWLVYYTQKFMLQKRGRELGTYILLGLEKRQVARMFKLENLAVGTAALLAGMLLGGVVHQALRAVLLNMFDKTYIFSLGFSPLAILLTVVYFLVIFAVSTHLCGRRIGKMSIRDMMDLDADNEAALVHGGKKRRKLFTASIVCGVVGTLLVVTRSFGLAVIGSLLLIFFCYGFFISFAAGVPAWFDKRPAKKFNSSTLLIFRSLASKLGSMGITMGTIALIFTATLVATGTALLFQNQFRQREVLTTNFDLFISAGGGSTALEYYEPYIEENLTVTAGHRYTTYNAPTSPVGEYLSGRENYWPYFEEDQVLRYSDYAALREVLDLEPVALEEGEYILHCMEFLAADLESFTGPVTLGGQTLTKGAMYHEILTQYSWDGNGSGFIIVVPDTAAEGLVPSREIWAMMTTEPVNGAVYAALQDLRDTRPGTGEDVHETLESRAAIREENAFSSTVVVFPLYYFALILIMVAATILTIQFLSDAEKYRRQYAILHDMGMDKRELRKTLNRHFLVFYAMPVLPPVVICITFIIALGSAFDAGIIVGVAHMLGIIGLCLGLFFLIYLLYVFAASSSLKRNVLPA